MPPKQNAALDRAARRRAYMRIAEQALARAFRTAEPAEIRACQLRFREAAVREALRRTK